MLILYYCINIKRYLFKFYRIHQNQYYNIKQYVSPFLSFVAPNFKTIFTQKLQDIFTNNHKEMPSNSWY